MAKSKKARRRARARLPLEALPEFVQRHIQAIGLSTVEGYLDWCRELGFPARWTNKSTRQMFEEVTRANRMRVEGRFRTARTGRHPHRMVMRMLEAAEAGASIDYDSLDGVEQRVARALTDPKRRPAERAFAAALLRHLVAVCPKFLFERATNRGALWIDAVLRLAPFVGELRREIEGWRPRSKNGERRFASLTRHLFVLWDVPELFDRVWLDDDPLSERARSWFVHIGQGQNLRSAEGLPFPLTKRMAHQTLRAPAESTIAEALRWGQVHALGGDARLARAIRGTRLTEGFDHEPFWSEVVEWLVRQPMFDLDHIGPIVDWVHHHRFQETRIVDERGRCRIVPPPDPDLSLRGRTLANVLRRVEEWHTALGRRRRRDYEVSWSPSGIPGLSSAARDEDGAFLGIYTIRELCDSAQLFAEGVALEHCVASYAASCQANKCSIWSLAFFSAKDHEEREPRRMITIAVATAARTVVQARGRRNQAPTRTARALLERWAKAVQLGVADWV